MAEDQGVNGDRWTEELSRLLNEFGWNKIADSNIDIISSEKIPHGIDSLYWYEDGFDLNRPKGVFLEAKRYATSSFQGKKLEDWIKTLNYKIRELIVSENLFKDYPEMGKAIKYNGLLAIWFHDLSNYESFKSTFIKKLEQINVPRIRKNTAIELNLFIIDNTKILELASMINEIKNIRKSTNDFNYYYPSISNNASNTLNILNLEYIFSKFILAKAVKSNGYQLENIDYVFYFGETTIDSFKLLISLLNTYNFISSNNTVCLYIHKRDIDVLRKIKPDIEKKFMDTGIRNIEIKQLDNLHDLPNWMVNE